MTGPSFSPNLLPTPHGDVACDYGFEDSTRGEGWVHR